MTAERRRYARTEVRLKVEVSLADIDQFVRQFAHNLSVDGMELSLNRPVDPGARLALRFQLAAGQPLLQVTGIVRWIRPVSKAWRVGLQFDSLDPDSRFFIEQAIVYRDERRRFRRTPAHLRVEIVAASAAQFAAARTYDISEAGMKLKLRQKVPSGALLDLSVRKPDGSVLFEAPTVVRWCHAVGSIYLAGVEFKELSPPARKFLRAAVAGDLGEKAARALFAEIETIKD